MTVEEQDEKAFEERWQYKVSIQYNTNPPYRVYTKEEYNSAKEWFLEGRRTLREQQQEWHLKHHKDPFTGIAG